jgi:predicted dehydrogenase
MRLHTCCDVSSGALQKLREQYSGIKITEDYRTAVGDPEVDLIVLATAEHFRVPVYEAAVEARKPVFAEKPLAGTLAEARAVRDKVIGARLPFCIGHNRRFSPAMAEAREIFRRHMNNPSPCPWRFRRDGFEAVRDIVGREEKVAAVSIRINDDWLSWKSVHMKGGNAEYGLLLSEMTHFADLACWFLDDVPQRVGVLSSGVLNHATVVQFRGGGVASIFMGGSGTFGYPKELLEAFGEGAAVVVDHMVEVRTAGIAGVPQCKTYPFLNDRHPEIGKQGGLHGWLEKRRAACDEGSSSGEGGWISSAEPDKGHARMLEAFVEEIRGQRSQPVSPIDAAVRAMEICTAAIRSFREKRFVDISEI